VDAAPKLRSTVGGSLARLRSCVSQLVGWRLNLYGRRAMRSYRRTGDRNHRQSLHGWRSGRMAALGADRHDRRCRAAHRGTPHFQLQGFERARLSSRNRRARKRGSTIGPPARTAEARCIRGRARVRRPGPFSARIQSRNRQDTWFVHALRACGSAGKLTWTPAVDGNALAHVSLGGMRAAFPGEQFALPRRCVTTGGNCLKRNVPCRRAVRAPHIHASPLSRGSPVTKSA